MSWRRPLRGRNLETTVCFYSCVRFVSVAVCLDVIYIYIYTCEYSWSTILTEIPYWSPVNTTGVYEVERCLGRAGLVLWSPSTWPSFSWDLAASAAPTAPAQLFLNSSFLRGVRTKGHKPLLTFRRDGFPSQSASKSDPPTPANRYRSE